MLLSNLFIYNRKATLHSTFFTRKYNTLCRALSETPSRENPHSQAPKKICCVCCFGVVALNLLFLLWWVSEFLFHVVCCCPSFCLFRKPAPPLPLLHSKTCFSQFLLASAKQKPVSKRLAHFFLSSHHFTLIFCFAAFFTSREAAGQVMA